MTVLSFIFWLFIAYYSKIYALFISWLYFLLQNSLIVLCLCIIHMFKNIKKKSQEIEHFLIQNDPEQKVSSGMIKYLKLYCSFIDYVNDKYIRVFNYITQYYIFGIIYRYIILLDRTLDALRYTFIDIITGYIKRLFSGIMSNVTQNIGKVMAGDNIEMPQGRANNGNMQMLEQLNSMTNTLQQSMGTLMNLEKMKPKSKHSKLLANIKANID